MKFNAVLLLSGKTATGIEVPVEIVTGLGSSKKPAVSVTINGYTYRSTIASMGGKFMLPVSAENRAGAKIAAGDKIEVEVELDTAPREVNVPADFAAALAENAGAKAAFEKLSYSHKSQHTLAIEQARTAETRQRRIEKSIAMLSEGKS